MLDTLSTILANMLSNAGHYFKWLIIYLCTAYTYLLIFRILLQISRANFYNPICQFILTFTNPVVIPLRRIIPGYFKFDIPTLVAVIGLFYIVEQVNWMMITSQVTPYTIRIVASYKLFIVVIGKLLQFTVNIYYYTLLFGAIISIMFALFGFGGSHASHLNPIFDLLYTVNEPLLAKFRRFIKPISGFDLSVLAAILFLIMCSALVTSPLMSVEALINEKDLYEVYVPGERTPVITTQS